MIVKYNHKEIRPRLWNLDANRGGKRMRVPIRYMTIKTWKKNPFRQTFADSTFSDLMEKEAQKEKERMEAMSEEEMGKEIQEILA